MLEAPYGVALNTVFEGGICLNANINRKSIWHETAHLLGAKDHYDENNKQQSINCTMPGNCFMQWNSLNGDCFCLQSLREIRDHLNKCKISNLGGCSDPFV